MDTQLRNLQRQTMADPSVINLLQYVRALERVVGMAEIPTATSPSDDLIRTVRRKPKPKRLAFK